MLERFGDGVKNTINGLRCIGLRQAGAVGDGGNEIAFIQVLVPPLIY